MAKLRIKADPSMVYAQSWGLSRWVGSWQSLDLEDADLENLELPFNTICTYRTSGGGDIETTQ